MAGNALDLKALSAAICDGVTKGNESLIAALVTVSGNSHALRNQVQANVDKVWEIDGELKLLKGVTVMLVGSGDGSTGMVPRMEKELGEVKSDVSDLKSDVREVRGDVSTIMGDIKAIRESQATQKSFMDGWKGVAVALGIVGACMTIIGTLIAGAVWLFQHGGAK
jgi:outer membrane murein-binding lipoprotein Lpp